MEKIDNLDRKILDIISQNARIPFKDVAAEFQHAVEIGAKIISPVSLMDWGHLVCYIADPDGHVIALAQEIVVND